MTRLLNRYASPPSLLVAGLAAYLLLAAALSFFQVGYLNADFVGYSTIAHRLLKDPPASVTGYWSSLYAWCMTPLISAGMDDLLAGRLVLLAGGTLYILGVFAVACRFRTEDENRNRIVIIAVMTVAVIQSATWATRLLDPDLLADALLFCYFYLVLDPKLLHKPQRACACGAMAGMAYLGKAYMLPFTLMHLPATLIMRWSVLRREGGGPKTGLHRWAITLFAFFVGLFAIAGPWIAVLTCHYGKPTFSTAGPANHANMSPTSFGKDPLWNPGLTADFIADPHYGPDWSAWQDREHFMQQLKVIAYNLNNCISYVLPWAVFAVIFSLAGRGGRGSGPSATTTWRVAPRGSWWCIVTILLFCGGYSLINLESRYIVPAITPLLCLAAMLVVSDKAYLSENRLDGILGRWQRSAWRVVVVILLVSAQDVYRMVGIPVQHPQSTRLARYNPIVEKLRAAHIESKVFAANRWHDGLYVSYAAENVRNYLGAPLLNLPAGLMGQLQQSSAAVYLRWHVLNAPRQAAALDAFVPAAPWKLLSTVPDLDSAAVVEIYALPW